MITRVALNTLKYSIDEINIAITHTIQSIEYLDAFVRNYPQSKTSRDNLDRLKAYRDNLRNTFNSMNSLYEAYNDILEDKD